MQHCTLFRTLQLHDRLDNERKTGGQSFPFISFCLHNFYFTQSEIVFLNGQRDVLLHTSFGTGGGFVPRSVTKKIAKPWPPSLPSPHPTLTQTPTPTHTNNHFRIIYCLSSFLQKHCARSGFGSFWSLTNLPNASENYLSCQTILMPLSIAWSK